MQLDLFNWEEISSLKDEISKVKRSSDQVRKGLFARHNSLEQYMTEIRDDVRSLDRKLDRMARKDYEKDMEPQELRKVS